jgi:hypothetical protein
MTHMYVVAGARVRTPFPADDVPTDGYADVDVEVVLADAPPAVHLALPGPPSAWLDQQGRTVYVRDPPPPTAAGWLLRQAVPFASAVQRACVLHAAAVETETGVVAFIGESGAGKSTLAAHLGQCGHRVVSDDLLPIRFEFDGHGVAVPTSAGALPLVAVYFLGRHDGPAREDHLDPTAALDLLIHNGFGEMRSARAWSFLFDAYHRIAERVPCQRLRARAGLEHLDETRLLIVNGIGHRSWAD